MTQRALRRRFRPVIQDTACLSVVQLGTALKSDNDDIDDIWTFVPTESHIGPSDTRQKSGKTPKYKNMFEFSNRHKTNLPLHRGYWKIPGLTNNLLGGHSEDFLAKKHMKERGIYEAKFRDWYNRLVHENTIILPPIQTSTRVQELIPDSSRLSENKFTSSHLLCSGPVKKFARDEIHLPNVYSNGMGCQECKRISTSEIYEEDYMSRNLKSPVCCKPPESRKNIIGIHHCDVLGKRYCKSCIEKRNKELSKQLEEHLVSSIRKPYAHYKATGL